MFKAVIFDKDGTLITIDKLWSKVYREATKKFFQQNKIGVDIEEAMISIGINGDNIENGSVSSIGSIQEVLRTVLNSPLNAEKLSEEALINEYEALITQKVKENQQYIELIHEDVPSILKKLRDKKVKIGLITTDSRDNTVFMLEYLGIENYFDYIGCGDDEHLKAKPSRDHGRFFMNFANLKPSHVLMVGDSRYDELFAEKLGFDFIKINHRRDVQRLHSILKI